MGCEVKKPSPSSLCKLVEWGRPTWRHQLWEKIVNLKQGPKKSSGRQFWPVLLSFPSLPSFHLSLRPPNSPSASHGSSSSGRWSTCSAPGCSTSCSSRPPPAQAAPLAVAWICLSRIPNIYLGGLAIPSHEPSGLKTPRSKRRRTRTRTRARGKGTRRWWNWAKSGFPSKSAHVMLGGSHMEGDQKVATRDAIKIVSFSISYQVVQILICRALISKSRVQEY